MSENKRQLSLNVFLFGTGHHEASWRLPQATPERIIDLRYVRQIAETSERGLLDAIFAADFQGGNSKWLEPFTLLSALAVHTQRIGLIATVETNYNEPFHVARKFASLDHISKGRAGWNIVTGAGSGAGNFTRPGHPDHDERYEIGDEFVEIVTQLWDSWDDDAVLNDQQSGLRYDETKIREIDFVGKHYQVKGPLNLSRPPQGRPVLVQSGSSEAGKEFAAKWGELIFTAQQSLEEGQAFYRDVKSRLAKYGRRPDEVKIAPGLCFVLGETAEQARANEEELNKFIDQREAIVRLSERFGIDLSTHPLDEPLVLSHAKKAEEVQGVRSRHQLLLDYVQREKPTLRRLISLVASGRGHLNFVGTPHQLADVIEQWFRHEAADGFNLMPQVFPRDLELFVDRVVPELQRRGLFRTAYEGTTLRDHLGLARPVNRPRLATAV